MSLWEKGRVDATMRESASKDKICWGLKPPDPAIGVAQSSPTSNLRPGPITGTLSSSPETGVNERYEQNIIG